MSSHSPYHRKGAPGGLGCRVNLLPVQGQSAQGTPTAFALLDAGKEATEIELLRTIAKGLGVKWGQDDAGWWAAVPEKPISAFAAALYKAATDPAIANSAHALYREDDNGGRFLIGQFDTRQAAEARAKELATGGHKQFYFVEPVEATTPQG
jgi:hypothetical protein